MNITRWRLQGEVGTGLCIRARSGQKLSICRATADSVVLHRRVRRMESAHSFWLPLRSQTVFTLSYTLLLHTHQYHLTKQGEGFALSPLVPWKIKSDRQICRPSSLLQGKPNSLNLASCCK